MLTKVVLNKRILSLTLYNSTTLIVCTSTFSDLTMVSSTMAFSASPGLVQVTRTVRVRSRACTSFFPTVTDLRPIDQQVFINFDSLDKMKVRVLLFEGRFIQQ